MEDFDTVARDLLAAAGGAVGLRKAADLLGVAPPAIHASITSNAALGVMLDDEILLPRVQFVEVDGHTSIVPGLIGVLAAFEEGLEGKWAALQFLLDRNPILREAPICALKAGRAQEAAYAARAYVGLRDG